MGKKYINRIPRTFMAILAGILTVTDGATGGIITGRRHVGEGRMD